MNAEGIGLTSLHLGGGRATKESAIDPAVGVVLEKKVGDVVRPGDTLAVVHAADKAAAEKAAAELRACYTISPEKAHRAPFIKGVIR